MNKEVKRIFVVLFFYALAGGVFYNFQELWMVENNLSTKSIGIVLSLCALLTVSTIFLCSNFIDRKKIKKFSCILLLLKTIILLALFMLHNTGLNVLIKLLIMADYVIDTEVYACIYPMISYITKSDKIYAMRGLIYSYAYYGGTLITSLLLGKTISHLNINFNSYCFIAGILMLVAYLIMRKTDIDKYSKGKKSTSGVAIFNKVLNKAKHDKITRNYLGFVLFGNASYNSINGLLIILLTSSLGFSASGAFNFKLILGIIAVFLATLILEKLTFKNNYINLSIKFVGRLILFGLAFLTNNKLVFLIAIIFMRLLSESYSHITDAPYVNRFSADEQLAFNNLREMVNYLSKAIGNFFCGVALTLGTRYNFLFALIFIFFQIIFAFRALKFYNLEKKEK